MEQLLLINPKKRRKTRASNPKRRRRTRRTAAPIARRRHRRRHNPIMSLAPRRHRRRRSNPIVGRRRHHRRRRNPISSGSIMSVIKPTFQGVAGALIVDLIMGNVPIPVSLKTGPVRHLVKGALAVGLGMIAKNFAGRAMAQEMAQGAMIVTFHDAAKEMLATALPTLKLGEYAGIGYYSPGMIQRMGEYLPQESYNSIPSASNEMSEYVY